MSGTAAISSNLQALRRILAGLVAMAGFSRGSAGSASPLDQEKSPCESDEEARRPDARRLPRNGEVFLPRHLRLAVLRLLRPTESAARRLIIAAARGLTVTLPPPRRRKPKPVTAEPFLRRFGIAVIAPLILPRSRERGTTEGGGGGGLGTAGSRPDAPASGESGPHPEVLACSEPRRTALPLVDPPRRIRLTTSRRPVPAHAAPRISFPGVTAAPRPEMRAFGVSQRTPDDPIDAFPLAQRLAALSAALDDLPAQARRFALWQARQRRRSESPSPLWGSEGRARPVARPGKVRGGGSLGATLGIKCAAATKPRPRRISPLRPGRPPGGRLARFDPSARRSRNIREVDEVLAHAHALALYALEVPDTS